MSENHTANIYRDLAKQRFSKVLETTELDLSSDQRTKLILALSEFEDSTYLYGYYMGRGAIKAEVARMSS